MLSDYFDAYATAYRPYKGGAFCYEDGCLYRGLIVLSEATGDPRWERHLLRLLGAQVGPDGALAGYDAGEFNIDNILAGRALLHLYRRTGESRWLAGAERLAAQLDQHPRTRSGVYWHKQIYPWQVWLDGLYMGLPFQVEFGQIAGRADLVADALEQMRTALALTWSPETGLYSHGYDEQRVQAWADPCTGRSRAHWARALGWLAMSLADIADLIGPDAFENEGFGEVARGLSERLARLATSHGLWLQVIDAPELAGNYEENSASAMFAYALPTFDRLGLVPGATSTGRRALERLVALVEREGHLPAVCHVAGLGGFGGRYRDGTRAYYLSESIQPDDVKGVGPLMMAAGETARGLAGRSTEEPAAPSRERLTEI